MTLSKIQQAAIAVQNGMKPEAAAKKYGVDLKELNRQIAEYLNGGKPDEIGDTVRISTRKDGSVKKTKEKNPDGTTTVTKYDDDGTVKKSRVKLSFKDKVKNGWKGVKNFGKELVCNKDGKVSVGKVVGLVGTAAALVLAAPVAGVLGAGAATVATIATVCEVAGTVMAAGLVVNGAVNITKGEIDYHKAQDKASAEAAAQQIGEGTASVGLAVLPKALSRIGRKLVKPFKDLFKREPKQVEIKQDYSKPNEKLVYEYNENGEIIGSYDPSKGTKISGKPANGTAATGETTVNTTYDENGFIVREEIKAPSKNNPNNTTEITKTLDTETGNTAVEESTLLGTDNILQKRMSMLKYAEDRPEICAVEHGYHITTELAVKDILRKDPTLIDEFYSIKDSNGTQLFKNEADIFNFIEKIENYRKISSMGDHSPRSLRTYMNNPVIQQLMLAEESPAAAANKFFKYSLVDAQIPNDIKAENPGAIGTNNILQRRISMLKYAEDRPEICAVEHGYHITTELAVKDILRKDPTLIDEFYSIKDSNGTQLFKNEADIFNFIEKIENYRKISSMGDHSPRLLRTYMNNPVMQQLMLTEESPAAAANKFFKYNLGEANTK